MSAASSEEAAHAPCVPDVDRALDLAELALHDGGLTVLGWADNTVEVIAEDGLDRPLLFEVFPEVQRSHEDEVLIIAVRPPHPDEMALDEVLRG